MRRLRRPQVLLPTLRAAGPGARKAEEHRQIKERDPDAELAFRDHWNRPDVRGALYAMHGGVCAYCNAGIEPDRGDVDHFRPKSPSRDGSHRGYWWLAYELGNYFLACRTCNQQRKQEHFPLEPGAIRTEYATRAGTGAERRLLIDPGVDPVEEWLKVDCLDEAQACPVTMRPSCSSDALAPKRVATTIDFFRINQDVRLIRARVRAREDATERLDAYRREPSGARREALCRRASRFHSQGMTVRAFLEDFAPDIAPPSPEEELRWLLEELGALLLHDVQCADRDETCRRQAEEIQWALAVLWKDPPTGTPTQVEQWLDETGWRTSVEPIYRHLHP